MCCWFNGSCPMGPQGICDWEICGKSRFITQFQAEPQYTALSSDLSATWKKYRKRVTSTSCCQLCTLNGISVSVHFCAKLLHNAYKIVNRILEGTKGWGVGTHKLLKHSMRLCVQLKSNKLQKGLNLRGSGSSALNYNCVKFSVSILWRYKGAVGAGLSQPPPALSQGAPISVHIMHCFERK